MSDNRPGAAQTSLDYGGRLTCTIRSAMLVGPRSGPPSSTSCRCRRRFGKKNTAIFGFLLVGVADGLNFLLPSTTVGFTILLARSFIGVAIPNGIVWAMVSDVIDHGQWRTGKRREGITYSMFTFSCKTAQSIAGGLAGFGLTLVGYVANAAQAPSTLLGIKALQTLYPCLAFLIAAAILLLLYKLTDARQAQIVSDLRASDQVAEVSGDIEGEIDPRAVHAGAVTTAPDGPRDGDRSEGTPPARR